VLETVERNARAQAQLIEDLLDVSRILAGKLRLEVEPLVLDGIVAAALETVQPAAEAKDIRIQATCARDCRVMADPHRFQQVVWNLLSNAVKFTPRGGLVQIAVDRDGDGATVTVTDTGRGIAKELQEHIFDRFRQADGSTTRSHGGLGLGLSIVRQLVEMHGGTVSVASDGEGRGARFTVRLPLAETNRRGAVQTISAPSANHTAPVPIFERPPELLGISVLVVDDELDTRELIGAVVESCGARPTLAGSAAEALARIAESRPDLILSDIGMPGEDGYAFLRKLRALPAAAGGDIPAIALTAFARAQDRARALQSGFNSYIAKPVDPTELFAVMVSLRRALR
jgi:CheY-like chemotaxis protein